MLVDKEVLVVGGSSGIGLAVARAASAQGASVTIASRNQDKLRAAAESIDGAANTMVVDATDPKSVQEMFGALGTIDHLAVTTHDSGKALSRTMLPLADIDLEQAEIYFRSRFWAKVICTKYAIPHLSETGSIVLTSGPVARGYTEHHCIHAGNNAAVEAFARKVAPEIGPKRINVVSPGLTMNTETFANVDEESLDHIREYFASNLPVGFVAVPDDVAPAYIFCMTTRYLSGVYIEADGGFNAWNPQSMTTGSFSAS